MAALCREHDLVLIEDCCDALGSASAGSQVGTFGAAATFSFYPAHHMTTGEGGAVVADDPTWLRALGSLREWGRDCWCPPGVNDACGRRFEGRFGELPAGYDHKYVFSHVGFNFKVTDMQAALGLRSSSKLDGFGARRRENFAHLARRARAARRPARAPARAPGADPSWFGFPFTLREGGSDAPPRTAASSCSSARSTTACCSAATSSASRASSAASTASRRRCDTPTASWRPRSGSAAGRA